MKSWKLSWKCALGHISRTRISPPVLFIPNRRKGVRLTFPCDAWCIDSFSAGAVHDIASYSYHISSFLQFVSVWFSKYDILQIWTRTSQLMAGLDESGLEGRDSCRKAMPAGGWIGVKFRGLEKNHQIKLLIAPVHSDLTQLGWPNS